MDPHNGHDRAPSWIPTRHLYQYFVPPWKTAIETAKPLTVMESYSETDGVPNVANRDTTQYLLRQRLGFDGVVTD
jgi:beta-glucosidase